MTDASRTFTDGRAYERLMGRWSRRVGAGFLDWLDVPDGLTWLDIGCGNGAFTEELIARCAPAAVTAVDPSEEQLAYARTRRGTAMARFESGDAQALPFPDRSVDVAIMALVIAFLPDPAKAVAEMVRVVRPGGWIATYMWDIPGGGVPIQPLYAALASMGMDAPRPPNPEASRQDVMRELWAAAGLADIGTRVIPIPVVYDGLDDFWDSNVVPIGPQGKMLHDLSAAAKVQLRQRLSEQLPAEADGRIAYEAFSNAVKGRVPG